MATYEKLGIQVDLIIGSDFKNKIKVVQKQLDSLSTKNVGNLAASMDNLTNGLSKSSSALKETAKSVSAVGKESEEAAKKTKGFSTAMKGLTVHVAQIMALRAVFHTITSAVSTAVSGVIDLDQNIAEIGAISTASAEQMRGFEEAALAIGASSKFTAVEVSETMKMLAQAGVQAADLASVTKNVEFFATGTGSGAMEATKAFTTAMRVWNIEGEESVRISNVLTAAMNNSKLTTNDMSTAFNYLANQGEALGIGLEETSAIIATMTNRGMRASTVGTGMSGVLTRLAKPTARIATLMETYGISLDKVNPQTNKFADILDTLNAAGVTTVDILGSFERRTGRALVTALGAGGQAFRTMEKNVTGTNASLLAYTKVMDGARAQLNVLQSELLVLVKSLASDLAPGISAIMEITRQLVAGLGTAEGKFALLAVAVGAAAAAIAALATLSAPVLALIGGVAALGLTVASVGAEELEATKHTESMRKEWAKTAEVLQRSTMDINDLNGALDEANTASASYVELTHNQQSKIKELSKTYPELTKFIGLQKVAYEDIAGAMEKVNDLQEQAIKSAAEASIVNYNKIITQSVNPLKKEELRLTSEIKNIEIERNSIAKLGISGTTRVREANEKIAAKRSELAEVRKELDEATKSLEATGASGLQSTVAGDYGQLRYDETEKLEKASREESAKSLIAERERYTQAIKLSDKLIESKKEDLKVNTNLALANLEAQKADAAEEDKSSFDAKIRAEKISALKEEMRLEGEKLRVRAEQKNQTLAIRSLTDSEIAADAAATKEVERNLKTLEAALIKEGISVKEATSVTNGHRDAQKALNAELTVTVARYALMSKARESALERDTEKAATGDAVRALQLRDMQTQRINLENMKDELTAQLAGAGAELDKSKYAAQILTIDAAINELRITTSELANETPFDSFISGIRDAGKEAGSTNDVYRNLGTTLSDGLTGAITEMANALVSGEDAWKTFRDGMGDILADLGKQLMEYAIKLMIVKALMSAVSAFGGGGEVQAGTGDVSASPFQSFITGALGIEQFADGGAVPTEGYAPNVDSVPALLMPGEFVMRKSSVDKYGLDTFSRMNAQHFADGGLVGGGSPATGTVNGEDTGNEVILNIINVVDPRSIPKTTGTEILNVISMDASVNGPATRAIRARIAT